MQFTLFTLTICLIISIHQIYEYFYFHIDMESCDIYNRSKVFFGELFLLSLSMSRHLASNFLTTCITSMVFRKMKTATSKQHSIYLFFVEIYGEKVFKIMEIIIYINLEVLLIESPQVGFLNHHK